MPWSISEVDAELVAASSLAPRVSEETRGRLVCRIDHLLDRRLLLMQSARDGVSTAPR